jgi:hypothetical protein
VFNPDLRYSSSCLNVTAQRAIKVLYQRIPDVATLLNPDQAFPASTSVEELCLPLNIYEAIRLALEQSNEMLPVSARRFRDWDVALLDRFER